MRTRIGGSIGRIGHRVLGAIIAASGPTVTNSSALGAAPLILSATDTGFDAGARIHWEFAASLTPAKNADGTYTTPSQFGVTFIDGDSWARLDLACGYVTPAGPYSFHFRVVVDNENGVTAITDQYGQTATYDAQTFSNDFADTINVSVAVLTTANGTSKNSNMVVSGSPALTYHGTNGVGAYQPVRATVQAQAAQVQFEVTINALNGTTTLPLVGFDDGTGNFNSGFKGPGYTTSTGIAVRYSTGEIKVWWNTGGNSFTFSTTAGVIAVGDILTIRFDSAAHTMDVWRTRSSTTTKLGGQATGLPTLSAYWEYAATQNAEGGTLNNGGTTFAMALSGVYQNYG